MKNNNKNTHNKADGNIAESFIGGTFSLTLSAVIVKVIGLIYKIPLASILGDQGMGYFNSAYTVFAFFYLLCTAGVPKAVMILVSEAKVKGYASEEDKIVRVAMGLFAIIGGTVTAIFIIFASPIAALIGNSMSVLTMVAIAPSVVMLSLSGVVRGKLSANMQLLDISVSQVIEGVGKLCFGLALAILGHRLNLPLNVLSAITILGVTIGSGIGLIYLLICSKIKIKRDIIGQNEDKSTRKHIIKSILSISVPLTLSAAVMSITNIIDLGLIMRSLTKIGYDESLASSLYGNYTTLAVPMFNLAISVISPISIAYLPIFTRCIVKNDNEGLKHFERGAIELTSVFSAPIMIGMIFFSQEILTLLFPKSEISLGSTLLCLIAPSILFSSLLLVVNTILEAKGRVKAPLISMAVGGVAKIFVSYFLITGTSLGVLGAPIGTVVSYAVALIISIIIYGSTFKTYIPLFSTSLLPYLSGFVSVLFSRIVYDRLALSMPKSPALLISIAFAALIYLIISVATGIIAPKKIKELAKYTKYT